MRGFLAIFTAVACDDGTDGPIVPPEPEPPACEHVRAVVVEGPEVVCADPSARDAGRFDRTEAPQQALTEAVLTSAGIVVADFTGDGRLDTFLPHITHSQLAVALPGGGAEEQAAERLPGIDFTAAVGGTAVDVEGDGDFDLFVTRFQRPNLLLRNDGTGHFADVTALAGLDVYAWRSQSSSWADLDNDGDLDLFVGGYGPTPDELYDSPDIPPSEDRSELWLNNGDGTFTDVSSMLPAEVHDGWTFMSSWFDLDLDGFPELFAWHDFGTSHPSTMLKNEGGTALVPILGQTQIDAAFEDMGVGVADLNHDGLPDFATTSFEKTRLLLSRPTTTNPSGALWVESSEALGVVVDLVNRGQAYGWGAEFGDLDHDRDDDLVMVFGYWSTYTGPRDPVLQVDGVWVQDGATGVFENLAGDPTWGMNDEGIGRGLLLVDVNADGFLDVLKRELDGPALAYLSRCDDSAWLQVELRQEGANRFAVGARVTAISPDGFEQTRWIHAGSSSMYSGGPPVAHFGLGADEVAALRITWPDGSESEVCEVATRRTVTVTRTQ